MESTAGPLRASGRWLVALFWPSSTGPDLRLILASLPVQFAGPAIIALPWLAAWAGRDRLLGKLTPLLVTVLIVVLLLAAVPVLTTAQRRLLGAMRGVDIPPPAQARRTTRRGLMTWLRAEATWRQVAYHVLVAPFLAAAGLLMPVMWAAGVALAAIFAYVGLLNTLGIKFIEPGHTVVYGYLTVLGVLALLAAPRVGAAAVRLDVWVAQALLGPSRVEALEHRVETLTESRAAWWTPRTPSGGVSSGTCTTVPSSAWCRWP